MVTLKLTQIGNSVGAVFPKEALAKLGVGNRTEAVGKASQLGLIDL